MADFFIPPPPVLGELQGHEQALQFIEQAGDRLPHALLLGGPMGIGKSRLALELAERLLQNQSAVRKGAHPDFRWIGKGEEHKNDIPVGQIRALTGFFSHRAGLGGWKIAVIDAIDDLNKFGLNALLKTLEEPQGKALLILIRHGLRPVPPTIASRCMKIRLEPLDEQQSMAVLAAAGMAEDLARELLCLAPGRPGLALALAETRRLGEAASKAVKEGASLSVATLAELLDFAGNSRQLSAASAVFCAHAQAGAIAATEPDQAKIWSEGYLHIGLLFARQQEFMLDHGQTMASVLRVLPRVQGETSNKSNG